MKVKHFKFQDNIPFSEIEMQINAFLNSSQVKEVIDIKFNVSVRHSDRYTADETETTYLILYK
ncbi:sporulation protein Cse60 [Lachnobacterium bovis]|uniref:sporulation protein Cse60 n=1 Tax=Lachnobacterium bovis TaxID=140626 RepID=UPI000489A8A9|nr:sporulation protein Cse60 [Lachnobacterium bovis]